jgi:cell division inhibitor SepF
MGVMNSVMSFFGFGSSEAASSDAPAKPKPAAPRPRRSADMSEIVTLEPQGYQDAKEVAAHFRQGVPVIVNIGALSEADARKMLDFMIGLKEGLEGSVKRVTPKVFLLSPASVTVTDADADEDGDEELAGF